MNRHAAGLLGALLLATSASATLIETPPDPDAAARTAWTTASVETLSARDNADALFTAALLLNHALMDHVGEVKLVPRRLALLDRAAALAPDAADIARTALATCRQVAGCDVDQHAARLRAAAPDDAGWLVPTLRTAVAARDEAAVTATLQRMADAKTFRDGWIASATRMERGLVQVRDMPWPREQDDAAPPTVARQAFAWGMASASLSMPYGDIARACKPDQAVFDTRQAACAQIGAQLEHADTMIGNLVGLRLAEWAATTPAARATIRQQRRTVRWLQEAWADQTQQGNPKTAARTAPAFHDAVVAAGGEAAGIRRLVAAAGLPTTPPAIWQSSDERRAAAQHSADRPAAAQHAATTAEP